MKSNFYFWYLVIAVCSGLSALFMAVAILIHEPTSSPGMRVATLICNSLTCILNIVLFISEKKKQK